jgi:hypothetical protein
MIKLVVLFLCFILWWLMATAHYNQVKHIADRDLFNAEVRATRYTRWGAYREPELPEDFYAMLIVLEIAKGIK